MHLRFSINNLIHTEQQLRPKFRKNFVRKHRANYNPIYDFAFHALIIRFVVFFFLLFSKGTKKKQTFHTKYVTFAQLSHESSHLYWNVLIAPPSISVWIYFICDIFPSWIHLCQLMTVSFHFFCVFLFEIIITTKEKREKCSKWMKSDHK